AGTVLLFGRLGSLAAVAPEGPGRRELAELVADHVLGHVELDEVPPVVDGEVLAHELGHDRAGPGPRLDRFAAAGGIGLDDLLEQSHNDERAFLERAPHVYSSGQYLVASGEWRVASEFHFAIRQALRRVPRLSSGPGRIPARRASPLATRHSPLNL